MEQQKQILGVGFAVLKSAIKYGKQLLEGMNGLPGLEAIKPNVLQRKANNKKDRKTAATI